MGLKGARATLSADRRTLTVVVPEASVCEADSTDEAFLARAVKDVLPFVRTIIARVTGGEGLSAYAAAHCSAPTPPSGSGEVVFEKTGQGQLETGPIRIRSKRWAIEWAHKGGTFVVFVMKGGEMDPRAIGSQRDSGRKRYKGPGTFKLNITGDGEWTVRVRDGG